jgi:DNA-binding XRE family transcriptional regulator
VRDALGRMTRRERMLIEKLKLRRQPMHEMGRHPALGALSGVTRAWREKTGLSLNGLAELAAVSRPTITAIEDDSQGATFNTFAWICWGLNVSFAAMGREIDRWLKNPPPPRG